MVAQRIRPFSGDFDTRDLGEVSRKALGVKEDEYGFNPELDSEKGIALKKAAYALGLHPSQAKKFLDKTMEVLNEISKEKATSELSEYKKKLNIEGDDKAIDEALSKKFSENGRDFDKIKKALGDSIYNPDVLAVFSPEGDGTGAPTTGDGHSTGDGKQRSRADIEHQIQSIIASKDYNDKTADKHLESQRKVESLEKTLYDLDVKGQQG